MNKPSEESIIGYFYGLTRNAYVFYTSEQIGLSHIAAINKYQKLSNKLLKYLSNSYCRELNEIDVNEICWELDLSITVEKITHDFWKSNTDVFTNPDLEFTKFADRVYPIRRFSEETTMSYYFGLSYLVKSDTPNREENIISLAKKFRMTFAPNITNERLLELQYYFQSDYKITELRYIAIDILDIRYTQTGKLPS